MEDRTNLDILREMTPKLTSFVKEQSRCFVNYKTETGTCFGEGLFSCDAAAAQRAFMSKGSVLPAHAHDCHEWLIIYEGRLSVVERGGAPTEYGVAACIYFPPQTEHYVTALEDCWMVGITVPGEGGYPSCKTTK